MYGGVVEGGLFASLHFIEFFPNKIPGETNQTSKVPTLVISFFFLRSTRRGGKGVRRVKKDERETTRFKMNRHDISHSLTTY